MKQVLKNRKIIAAAALTCAGILSSHAVADQPIVVDQQNAGNFIPNIGAWGFTIQVGSDDLIVNQVGFIDQNSDGLAANHGIGFWLLGDDGATQTNTLVATDTVLSGTTNVLDNGFRYNAVSAPITLLAGQSYSIVGATPGLGVDPIRDVRNSTSYANFNLNSGIVASPLTRFARGGGTLATDSPFLHRGYNSSFISANVKVTAVTTRSWTGSGSNFNSAANWGGTLPSFTTEDSGIAFNSSTPSTVNNDVTGADLRTLRYDAGAPAINITGNAFKITGSIANNSSNTQTISTGQITTNQSYINANGGNVIINSNINIPNSSLILVGTKDVTLNGNLTGAGSIEQSGTGTLTLNGDNSAFTGSIILDSNSGTLGNVNAVSGKPAMIIAPNAKALGSSSATVVPSVALATSTNKSVSSAVLQINGNDNYTQKMSLAGKDTWQPGQTTQYPQVQSVGNNTWSGAITFTGVSVNHVIESASGNFTISTPLQATSGTLHNLYFQGAGDFTLSGGISESGAAIAITKIGSGTAKITNTSSWTSLTRVQGGTLELDYTSAAGATQRLGTATLQMDGGTLKFTGNASANRLETVGTLQLNGFSVTAGVGASSIILNNGAAGTVGLTATNFTRGVGATLDVSGAGSLTLPASLGQPAFVPYITTGGGASYAAVDASNHVVPYATYSTDTYSAGLNTDATTSAPLNAATTNSLRFNTAAANTLTLTGTNTITSGGILVTSSVGAHTTTIDGTGTLVSGTGNELIVHQYNTAAPLVVNAQLFAGNTGTLTKSGPGQMTITSSNSFTGGASINDGSILVTNANGLQNANVVVVKNNGLVFQGLTDASIGMISGTGDLNIGAMNLTLDSAVNVGGIYSGKLTGSGNLIHNSVSTNTRLTGDNSGFSGNITINTGGLVVQTPTALGTTAGKTTVTATSLAGSSGNKGGTLIFRTAVDTNENITIAGSGFDGLVGALRIDNAAHVTFRQPVVVDADPAQAGNPTNQTIISIGDDGTANFAGGISASAAHPNPNLYLFSGGNLTAAANAHTGETVSNGGSQTGESAIGTISGNLSIGTGTLLVDGSWILTGNSNVWNGTKLTDFANLQIGDGGADGSLGSGSIQLNQNQNIQESDITINTGNLIFDRAGTMTVSNDISGSQLSNSNGSGFVPFGAGVQLYGTGTIIFTGNNSYNGGLTIANGTAVTGDSNLGSGTLSFISNGGTLLATNSLSNSSRNIFTGQGAVGTLDIGAFNSSFGTISGVGTLHKLGSAELTVQNITGGSILVDAGRVTVQQNGSTIGTVSLLSVANNASVDLNDNRLNVKYTGTSPLATLTSYLKTGFNGGAWNGTSAANGAILSAVAASVAANTGITNKTALGAFDNGTTVLVRYTYSGDANDDGSVDSNDFGLLAASFGATSKFWQNGDFNYDGIVNALDFNALATNYGASPMPGMTADGAVPLGSIGSIVPEPGTAGLMLSLAMGLVARRRRNH